MRLTPLCLSTLLVLSACSEHQTTTCDPSKCKPGNVCVGDKCMLKCAQHTDCPNGYDCRDTSGTLVCQPNNMPFATGKFGFSCGTNGQRDCADGFLCVGGQGDPAAYCTKQDCQSDADCPGYYYCGTKDIANPVDGGTPSRLQVKACLKRGFCAPASSAVDCADPDAVFLTQDGTGYCAKSCSGTDPNGCGGGRGCFDLNGLHVCLPLSRHCAPSHQYCGFCLSSADCPEGGICYVNSFNKDRYCIIDCPATGNCPATPGGVVSACYTFADQVNRCLPEQPDPNGPNASDIVGCYPPCPASGCR